MYDKHKQWLKKCWKRPQNNNELIDSESKKLDILDELFDTISPENIKYLIIAAKTDSENNIIATIVELDAAKDHNKKPIVKIL